jgi:hypothetical protein
VHDHGPESWKVKCGVRQADEVPMTDQGTLIMRSGPVSSRRAADKRLLRQTHQLHAAAIHVPSIAPLAIDLDPEDFEEPARNSDALGLLRQTSQVDYGATTTKTSFVAGLTAGLLTLAAGAAVAFVAFTTEPSAAFGSVPRAPHVVAHVANAIAIDAVETAELKAAPKKKTHRVVHKVSTDADSVGGLVGEMTEGEASEPAPAPQTPESE